MDGITAHEKWNEMMIDVDCRDRTISFAAKKHTQDTENANEKLIIAINKMKKQPEFHKCIADIGMDPFYVLYSTPT